MAHDDSLSVFGNAVMFLSQKNRFHLLKVIHRDFPGGPVVQTPSFQCKGLGFSPSSGNWIPHATTEDPTCHTWDPAQPKK